MNTSPLAGQTDLVSATLLINGNTLPDTYQLVSVTTRPSKRTSLESVFSKCAASIVLCLSFPAL